MNSFLKYEWRPHDDGVQITFTFNGSVFDMVKAIGMLIEQVYGNIRAEDRDFFSILLQAHDGQRLPDMASRAAKSDGHRSQGVAKTNAGGGGTE